MYNKKQTVVGGGNVLVRAELSLLAEEKKEYKQMSIQNLTVNDQNDKLSTNVQAMIRKKLTAMTKEHIPKGRADLDTKLKADELALKQQTFLIDTVLEKIQKNKKQTTEYAMKNLDRLRLNKWIKTHSKTPLKDYSTASHTKSPSQMTASHGGFFSTKSDKYPRHQSTLK